MIILVILRPQGCTQSGRSKSEAYGTFGSNRSGLNAVFFFFLRQTMKKKGQKREIKDYHTSELIIAFLYLVAPKGAVCLSDYPAAGHCCPLILVSPRLVFCAPWAFARLACSAHGRMRPLKELNRTLLSAPRLYKRRGHHSRLDSANTPNDQKTLFAL